ncbi:hypothetical protein BGX30_009167, partial [Mortierella sp. GBA39]
QLSCHLDQLLKFGRCAAVVDGPCRRLYAFRDAVRKPRDIDTCPRVGQHDVAFGNLRRPRDADFIQPFQAGHNERTFGAELLQHVCNRFGLVPVIDSQQLTVGSGRI